MIARKNNRTETIRNVMFFSVIMKNTTEINLQILRKKPSKIES